MTITLFLGGDTMLGRGVDQILAHPSSPELVEAYVRDARDYVKLAEQHGGAVPRGVSDEYVWGDALGAMRTADVRIVNLETSITGDGAPWPQKEVCYRMHPKNVGCLRAAGVDVCVLANNHVLDFGRSGLLETLEVLRGAGIAVAGAGRTLEEAAAPAIVASGGARALVFGLASATSGVPSEWAATGSRSGVWLLDDLSLDAAEQVGARISEQARQGDLVVASIHWGSNYGWDVSEGFTRFAHALLDRGVHVVHGHSSHHARPIEIRDGKLVLYGCGELVDDYEGIEGLARDAFRIDLAPLYFATFDPSRGRLERLRIEPMHLRKMRLERATDGDAAWLAGALAGESARFGTSVERRAGAIEASPLEQAQRAR